MMHLLDFLFEFHSKRDYFECHEIGEHFWKLSSDQKEKGVWLILIKTAVALYHKRRGNEKGANKMVKQIEKIYFKNKDTLNEIGFYEKEMLESIRDIATGKTYKSIILPMKESLKNDYILFAGSKNMQPFSSSDLLNDSIVNRHLKKNRNP